MSTANLELRVPVDRLTILVGYIDDPGAPRALVDILEELGERIVCSLRFSLYLLFVRCRTYTLVSELTAKHS